MYRKKINRILLGIFTSCFLLLSCGNHKNIIYFSRGNVSSDSLTKNSHPIRYQSNDLLSIIVSGPDLEVVKPFNLNVAGVTSTSSKEDSPNNNSNYLINSQGEIDFPVIGKVKLANLTREESILLLKEKLGQYIDQPFVNIQLVNFTITILGDVRRPGTYKMADEQVSLLEALGYAEDLNITGIRRNVIIIRDINGVKTEIEIDLTSKDFLNSEYYYLKQNDIIYVKPDNTKSNSALIGTSLNPIISLFSLTITSILFILK